jgi:hypothetical protein
VSEARSDEIEERIARIEERDRRLTEALELLARREAAPAREPDRNWDAYAAVIASFIGLLALAVSGYTAYVERQQLRAEVWPRVQVAYSGVNLSFLAINQGMGPARVTAMRVIMDGAVVRSWADVHRKLGFVGDERFHFSDLSHNVLPPGKDLTFLEPKADEENRAKFKELLPGGKHALSIMICYCSVLDECWVATHGKTPDDSDPGTCPIADAQRFTD